MVRGRERERESERASERERERERERESSHGARTISGSFRSMYITWNWYSQRLSATETANRPNDKVRGRQKENYPNVNSAA